jgi:hypothetical protein
MEKPDSLQAAIQQAKKIVAELERLRAENSALKEKLENQEVALKNKEVEWKELKNQLKVTKLAGQKQPTKPEEVAEMKRKLNQYIREIDECIKLLEL